LKSTGIHRVVRPNGAPRSLRHSVVHEGARWYVCGRSSKEMTRYTFSAQQCSSVVVVCQLVEPKRITARLEAARVNTVSRAAPEAMEETPPER
jgi:hypothetical protein